MTTMNWSDGNLTVRHDSQVFNAARGGMDIEVLGQITASGEWWLDTAVAILGMLPGKVAEDGSGFLLGPAHADPDLIGSLVATKLRDLSSPPDQPG